MKNRIAELRSKANNMTQQQLADMVGSVSLTISRLERGERQLSQKWMERLAPFLNCKPEDLISSGIEIFQAPLISWVQAGDFSEGNNPYENGDFESRVNTTHEKSTVLALRVLGESMDKVAPEGSIIIVDYADKDLIDGKFYVFRLNAEGETTFKRYRANPSRLEPYSSGEFETIFPSYDMVVVGRVVETSNKL